MNEELYYDIAEDASKNILWHPGIEIISQLAKKSPLVLDVGCGEGTKLAEILGKNRKGIGVDISAFAVKKARKKYPQHKFILAKDERLSFSTNSFDLVYSTFVLEHTTNPEVFLNEMITVANKGGYIVILCPNYGAPNRRSPVSTENPIIKLILGFMSDFNFTSKALNFKKVTPKKVFKEIDDDTTNEPYILNLTRFLKRSGKVSVKEFSSLWEIDNDAKSLHQKIFKYLGLKGIFPFKYWGPQLFIVLKKK
jgi:SAM-dependent methyltransferase